ncbi:MAG TPA: haloacid dehalogenase type II [Burkholderiales bacterium]|jgi:2-haloacid dehalogenase|nr:haloacid dehalogenase type II [Burkholderiales bacterium]
MQTKALAFDVFGTVVDWRSSITREGELLGAARGLKVDWAAFADAWRAGYRPAMDRVMRGESGWANIDRLHREILNSLLPKFAITGLSEADMQHLNRAWHRLMPWPDSVPGLNRLRSRYVLATLSNGNISLLVDMAKHAGLPWDCVLSGELIGKYKPDLEVYRMAARLLGVEAGELMLVAAHPPDLLAAKRAGLTAAYVPRPLEHGPGRPPLPADPSFDVVAADFLDLARKLGA